MKATPPNESTRTFSEEKAGAVTTQAIETLGTRRQHTQLSNSMREFIDVCGEDASKWVKYLLTRYLRCKYTPDYDDDFRQRLIRNTNAALVLAHDLYENNYYDGLLGEGRDKILGILMEFIHVSDEEAYGWIQYIFEEYIGSRAIVKHSADFRQRLTRNAVAVIDLTRILHEHHKGGGLYKLTQRGA